MQKDAINLHLEQDHAQPQVPLHKNSTAKGENGAKVVNGHLLHIERVPPITRQHVQQIVNKVASRNRRNITAKLIRLRVKISHQARIVPQGNQGAHAGNGRVA